MKDRLLLWIDLTLQESRIPTTRYFEDIFRIRHNSPEEMGDSTELERPDALCFDFDFPDRAGLELLEQTKRSHPSLPILMLTVQHSEELAVWAFRARVWDYFAKPVKRSDVKRCYESMCKIEAVGPGRRSVRIDTPVPNENKIGRYSSSDERSLAPAIAYIQSHFSDKIALRQLAEMCGMSPFRFSRMFHAEFNETFQDYLLRVRVERAEELLKNPALCISDVGDAVGFGDASYFGRVFRKSHNMSPTQWRHHHCVEQRPGLRIEPPQ